MRILSIIGFLLTSSQIFSYSTETLRAAKEMTETAEVAGSIIEFVSKNSINNGLRRIARTSGELTKLLSFALMDVSYKNQLSNVLARINREAPWQNASIIDSDFLKQFGFVLSHGIAREVTDYWCCKGADLAVKSCGSDSKIVLRSVRTIAESLVLAIVDTLFKNLKEGSKDKLNGFKDSLIQTATEIAAYHIAGEVIFSNAYDTKRDNLLIDIFELNN